MKRAVSPSLFSGSWALGTLSGSDQEPFPALVIPEGRVLDLRPALGAPELTIRTLLEGWSEVLPRLRSLASGPGGDWRSLEGLRVHAPVEPRQIFQSGANYRQHVIDLGVAHRVLGHPRTEERVRADVAEIMDRRAAEGLPYVFVGLPSAITGPYDDVVLPIWAKQPDWELELAVVISRPAYQVPVEEALSCVAGYTIANDLTDRATVFRTDMRRLRRRGTPVIALTTRRAPTSALEAPMRIATYEYRGRRRCGVVIDAAVRPFPDGTTLLGLIHSGFSGSDTELPPLGDPVPLDGIRLLPPLEPPSVRDFVTFEEHVEGVLRSMGGPPVVPEAWYDAPAFYFANPEALIGAHDDVPFPPGSQVLDFELEVAVVIGREGRDLTPEQARDHIAGYTLYNDWSARDLQTREMQVGLGPCKGKDTATTLGPYLVTPDELEPYRDPDGFLRLPLSAEINGEVVGKDLLSNMSWTFEEMIAYASRGTAVRPGDVLASGTCGNGGCLAELWGIRGETHPAVADARRHRHAHRGHPRLRPQHRRPRPRACTAANRPPTPPRPSMNRRAMLAGPWRPSSPALPRPVMTVVSTDRFLSSSIEEYL